jgi:TonB family protein
MPGWNQVQWFSLLAGVAFKSTVVFGAAWGTAFLLRRRSAAVRHLVWTAAAAAVLVLPLLSGFLPALRVTAPEALAQWDTGLVFRSAATGRVQPETGTAPGVPHAAAPGATAPWRPSVPLILATAWCLGTTILLVQMLAAYAAMRRIRRRLPEFPDRDLAGEAALAMGLGKPVRVLQTAPGTMPMTFGLRNPVVMLPADAMEWTEESRRMVLIHELAHVRRGDAVTHLLARSALALNWWNPLAWVAWREFLKERERAADDMVLICGAHASAYASRLLEVARSLQAAPVTAWAAIAMARRSQIEGRLLAILDSKTNRKQAGRAAVAVATILAIVLVAPFAAMHAQNDGQTPPEIDATIRAANAQKNHEILDNAASAYEKLRNYDAAQTLLESSLAIREQVSGAQSADYAAGLVRLGDLALKRHKVADAEGFYSKAVALGDRPEVAPALLFLGRTAYGERDYDGASDLLERALNADPAGALAGRALSWMAEAKNAAGDPAQAESLLQRALAVEAPDSSQTAMTLDLYAHFLRDQNRVGEAEPMEARAKEIRKALVAKLMPQAKAGDTVYKGGGGVAPPQLISKIEPSYTEEARALKVQGTEVLYVEIGTDGVASNFKVLNGVGFGLDEEGIEAVSQWRFKPGAKDGQPVRVAATIEINWRLM